MKYPNRLQVALLFDEPFDGLDAVARDFARVIEMKTGAIFNVPEQKSGVFVRLFGGARSTAGGEMMLTFEVLPGPGATETYEGALGSSITGILCPTMPQRVARASCHILLEVSHGAMSAVEDDTEKATMVGEVGADQGWTTQAAFHARLETLALMTRVTCDHIMPSAIHWTQSNLLIDPETFEQMAGPAASMSLPCPLTIHPILFGEPEEPGQTPRVGLRTLGARHWLGRELVVPATTLPWASAYQTVVAFCTMATSQSGHVVADGDTFGPEDGSEIWRVHHRNAASDDSASEGVATYELVPLRHDTCGFVAEDLAENPVPFANAGKDTPAIDVEMVAEFAQSSDTDPDASIETDTDAASTMDVAELAETDLPDASPDHEPDYEMAEPAPADRGDSQLSGTSLRARLYGNRSA